MKHNSMQGSRYGSRCAIQIAAKGLPIPLEILPVPLPQRLWTLNPAGLVIQDFTAARIAPDWIAARFASTRSE